MNRFIVATNLVAALFVPSFSALPAAELKSGLRPGDYVGSFDAIKCAGAVSDGIAVGDELCYCCELGLRPVVLVFARSGDPGLDPLLARIEQVLTKHRDRQLAGLVSLLGHDRQALVERAKKLGARHKLAEAALVVPVEHSGPADFDLNPETAVTVMIYKEAQVVNTYAFAPGALKADAIERIVTDAEQMLK